MSGLCRFPTHLKEIRFHLCQTGAASKGVRDFIKLHYVDLKSKNPKFPFLIRECSGVQPRVWLRYEKGKESSVSLSNLEAPDVLRHLEALLSRT